MTVPWHGRPVTLTVDGEELTARYLPHELVMMRTARQAGATDSELAVVHAVKAILDATIVDAETARADA